MFFCKDFLQIKPNIRSHVGIGPNSLTLNILLKSISKVDPFMAEIIDNSL